VVRTRVGYAGGETATPTYRRIGDHSETIQIDYDPTIISYRHLLELFWNSHDPTARSGSRQYRAAVFYHDEDQKRAALGTRGEAAARLKQPVRTDIQPFTGFTRAEAYHQKYYLRNRRELMQEFHRFGFSEREFADSTAAARVNGYLGGHGTRKQFENELPLLGLTEAGENLLRNIVRQKW
jgi:methionine-S-sulfoxide reductase